MWSMGIAASHVFYAVVSDSGTAEHVAVQFCMCTIQRLLSVSLRCSRKLERVCIV